MKVTRDHIYTAVFMLVVSAVCALILAAANAFFQPQIQENMLVAERQALLDVFGLDTTGTPEEVLSRYDDMIRTDEHAGIQLYRQINADGQTEGYAVEIEGGGLWGRIRGYLGVSPDLDALKGVVFTDQNETPGLGGRIDEPAFRDQFRGVPVEPGRALAYGQAGDHRIDAVTGATQTSKAVLKMLNDTLEQTIHKLEDLPE